jgi:hypothetical protein
MPCSNQVDGLVEEVGGDKTKNIKKASITRLLKN